MALPSQGYMSSSARITSEIQQGFDDITEEIAKGYASYVSTRTYGKDYKVLASNGIVYTSKSAPNSNNTPQADDGSNWFANVYDNLLGEWSDLIGTVYKGAGIHYLGGLYQVVSDIADVTVSVPSSGNASYSFVSNYNTKTLIKTDSMKVMFDLTGSVLTLDQDVVIKGQRVLSGTTVTLPTLVNASDYKILLLSDGSLSAQLYDTASPVGSVIVGGFHVYHTIGGINPRSLWDENWKPSSKSPRAMALSPDQRVWADIYFMDVEYALNNYSRPDVTIADGGSPPIVPEIYGGNGISTYGSLTWFEAWDLVINAGKRLAFWGEFSGLAYGVVEQQSVSTDPVTTKYQTGSRSVIGLEQATGVMWGWGADIQGSGDIATAITDGRGSVFSADLRAVLLGADWGSGVNSGSRSANWGSSPSSSLNNLGVRAVCDHLIL